MNKEELLNIITSQPKYYAGIYEQSHASQIVRSIRAGICKQSTEEAFFGAFGFMVDKPQTWKMKPQKWFDDFKSFASVHGYSHSGLYRDYEEYYDAGLTPEDAVLKVLQEIAK